MQALVTPKNRRPKFQLTLKIVDLNNVPLVSGTSFVKWHISHSTRTEHHGRTNKCHIKDHKVAYDYTATVQVQLTVDRSGVLQESTIHFEILQDYGGGTKGERIVLGNIKLNLAEYVDLPESTAEDDEGISRRYLMQDSRINSTLKIGLGMKLIEGERNFTAPRLNSAPIFEGITGVVASEQVERNDGVAVPSLNNKSRETGEIQDMYRQNLAAHWTAQPGELRADECIENIFAGGDGWGTMDQRQSGNRLTPDAEPHSYDRNEGRTRWLNLGSGGREKAAGDHAGQRYARDNNAHGGVSGRTSLEQHANDLKAEAEASSSKDTYEVNEFDVREDLASWKLSGKAF